METRRLLSIASVERTGSTLLCSILRGTKQAGTPIEYLNIHTRNFARFRQQHGVPKIKLPLRPPGWLRSATRRYPWRNISWFESGSYRQYLEQIAAVNTTENGVFGIKMHWNQYERHMLDLGVTVDFWKVPVAWVRITRRDEIRQAISFVRAAQTESWNSNMAATTEPVYDGPAIEQALDRIADENAHWSNYFASNNISPLHITYEELIGDTPATIDKIMNLIGAPIGAIPASLIRPQSDSRNGQWAAQFISEYPQHAHRAAFASGNSPATLEP